jgi:hypothetical protein
MAQPPTSSSAPVESNNAPELARLAAEQALSSHPTLLGNRILLAEQAVPLEPICL